MSHPTRFTGKATALLIAVAALFAGPARSFGQIFVSFAGNSGSADGVIKDFTTSGASSTTLSSTLTGPEGLAFWGADLYVATNTNAGAQAQILKFTGGTGSPSVFSSATGSLSTIGLAFDTAGNLFAANPGNQTIVKFAAGNGSPVLFATTGTNLNANGAYGLAVDSATNVYAAIYNNNTIVSYDSTGALRWTVGTGAGPRGLALNGDGSILFVANSSANTITTYNTATGGSIGTYATSADGLLGPSGLAFSGGNLYVANGGNSTIEMFTAANTGTSFAAGGFPAYLAVSAIPEPSTYAAIAGVAMLGFAGWRRRRQSLVAARPAAIV
jgi:DNA-binding beta-propeller fold protein YncE